MSDMDGLPSWAPTGDQPTAAATTTAANPGSGGGGRGRGIVSVILALLVLLGGVGAAAYFLLLDDSEEETAATDDDGGDGSAEAGEEADAGEEAAAADQAATDTSGEDTSGEGGTAADSESDAATEQGGEDEEDLGPPVDISDGSVRYTEIKGGVLHLKGTVPNQEMKDAIYDITVQTTGDPNLVVNELTIDPDSPSNTIGYPVYIADVVLFEFNSTTVDPEQTSVLDLGVDYLKVAEEATIIVYGHTDSVGSEETNLRISRERAQAVKDYYVSHGAPADRIYVVPRGERDASGDEDEDATSDERRVEFELGNIEDPPPEGADPLD